MLTGRRRLATHTGTLDSGASSNRRTDLILLDLPDSDPHAPHPNGPPQNAGLTHLHQKDETVNRLSDALDNATRRTPPPGIHGSDDDVVAKMEDWERQQKERETREHEERLTRCGFPLRLLGATLDGFTTPTEYHRLALDAAKTFVAGFIHGKPAPARCALFYGPPGTGKTHLACAIMRAVSRNFGVKYTTASDLAREVRSTYHRTAEHTEMDVLNAHVKPSLVTIDEIGVGLGTDHERAMLHDVVAKRYDAKRPTILLSNLNLDAIKDALGTRIVDRIREDDGLVLLLDGESFRGIAR